MIGIVIVTYNSEVEIGACLEAAQATGAQIVVVDNASEDGTRDQVTSRGVRLIANIENRGFAAAANQGIAALNTPFVLLLNPDAVIVGGIEQLTGFAAAGGQLLDCAGNPQTGFMVRRFPTPAALAFEALLINRMWPGNPVNRAYRCFDFHPSSPSAVDQPAGAFLMIRREIWQNLGGFDESFFPLWFEDVDFCKRLHDAGYQARYVPEAVAKHTGAHSIRKIAVEIRQFYWYRSLLKYAAKHFGPVAYRMVCLAVFAGSVLRLCIGVFRNGNRKSSAAYGKVMRLAAREFLARSKS